MNESDRRQQQLLASYRRAITPRREDEQRAWSRLQAEPDATPDAPVRRDRRAWWLWGTVALAAAAAALWLARPSPSTRVAQVHGDREQSVHGRRGLGRAAWVEGQGTAASPAQLPAPAPAELATERISAPPMELPAASPRPTSSAPSTTPATVARGEAPPARAPADALRAELAAIAEAREALDADDPALALSRIAAYRRRFPDGVLDIEAAAIRAAALCRGGNPTQGRGEARALLGRPAAAAYAALLRESCALQ